MTTGQPLEGWIPARADVEPAELVCEQFVYTTAARNLVDSGFGPLAQSAGWPAYDRSDRSGGLGELIRFLPEGSSSQIANGTPPPRCLAVCRLPIGTVLLAKHHLGADEGGRRNRYLVHALLDPSHRAGPRHLLHAVGSGALLTSLPPDLPVTDRLRQVPLPVDPGPPRAVTNAEPAARRDQLLRVTRYLLERERGGAPVVIRAADQFAAEGLVADLLAMLPWSVADALEISTYEREPAKAPYALMVAVPEFSRHDQAPTLDLAAQQLWEPDTDDVVNAAVVRLVDQHLRGAFPPRVQSLAGLVELESQRRLALAPVGTLGLDDLHRLLAGRHAQEWLRMEGVPDRLVYEIGAGDQSLRDALLKAVEGASEPVLDQVQGAALEASVTAVLEPGDDRSASELLLLVENLGLLPEVALRVWTKLDAELEAGRPITYRPDLEAALPLMLSADQQRQQRSPVVLAGRADLPGMPEAMMRDWTPVNDAVIMRQLLDDRGPAPEVSWFLVERHPERWRRHVDELLATGEIAPDDLSRALARAGTHAVNFIETVCGCEKLPPGFVLSELVNHPCLTAEQVADCVHGFWDSIARQAGFTEALTGLLRPAGGPELSVTQERWYQRWFRNREARD